MISKASESSLLATFKKSVIDIRNSGYNGKICEMHIANHASVKNANAAVAMTKLMA